MKTIQTWPFLYCLHCLDVNRLFLKGVYRQDILVDCIVKYIWLNLINVQPFRFFCLPFIYDPSIHLFSALTSSLSLFSKEMKLNNFVFSLLVKSTFVFFPPITSGSVKKSFYEAFYKKKKRNLFVTLFYVLIMKCVTACFSVIPSALKVFT